MVGQGLGLLFLAWVGSTTVSDATSHEAELMLADLIYQNNFSRILYVTQYPKTEKVSLRSSNSGFLKIHDVSCDNPAKFTHSYEYFLGTEDDMQMNIIIDCGDDDPIQDIMLSMLPLDIYPNISTTLAFPIFNVIVVTSSLPDESERGILYLTKGLSFSIVYVITSKANSTSDRIGSFQHQHVCDRVVLYKYDPSRGNNQSLENFVPKATLTTDCFMEGHTDVLWHTFNGFYGKVLRVGFVVDKPLIYPDIDSSTGKVVYRGLVKNLLDVLAEGLGFKYELVETVDGYYGVPHNGTWNGLIGMIIRMEIDFVITGLTTTTSRSEVVDFTVPFLREPVVAVYRAETPDVGWLSVFRPLQGKVWATVIGAIMLGWVCVWILQLPHLSRPTDCPREEGRCISLKEALWNVTGVCLNQGAVNIPSTSSSRSALMGSFLAAVLLVAYYNANLKASTVVPDSDPKYSVLADMLADNNARVFVNKGGANRELLEKSRNGILQGIWKKIVSNKGLTDSFVDGIISMMTDTPTAVAIGDKGSVLAFLYYNYRDECNWSLIPEGLYTSPLAITLPLHSPYRPIFNRIITRIIEMGLVDKWYENAYGLMQCGPPEVSLRPVTLVQIKSTLLILAVGMCLGIMAFMFERAGQKSQITRRIFVWNVYQKDLNGKGSL